MTDLNGASALVLGESSREVGIAEHSIGRIVTSWYGAAAKSAPVVSGQ